MIQQTNNFLQRYEKLNDSQRQAVDQIDGPLLVIAGPGSGKTELLSVRIANILDKTDTLPSGILCLTFTDAAAKNMLARLTRVIGPTAYEVGIHTFHSFGAEVIGRYPEYFYSGQELRIADDVIRVQILDQIFQELPYNTPLKSHRQGGHFSDFRTAKDIISKLKTAGLSPADFTDFLQGNVSFLEQTKDFIRDFWGSLNLRKKDSIGQVASLISFLESITTPDTSANPIFKSLKDHLLDDLKEAYAAASDDNKTSPITEWKKRYIDKDDQNTCVLKDFKKMAKNLAFAQVYKQYQESLESQGYIDYDDMLIKVVKALRENPELRYNLQERYLYFLIDEFQDTNGVQMEIVEAMTDSEVNEGNPNLFAVGDDDQSIFKFQGANISNILSFKNKYPQSEIVVLTANYRSNKDIIALVRKTIIQGQDRLENHLPEINKELFAANPNATTGEITTSFFTSAEQELAWIVEKVKTLINDGHKPEEIALITRKHSELIQAASYFETAGLTVNYENRKNVLKQKHIIQLTKILRFLNHISRQQHEAAEHYLAEILAFDFWQISRVAIWKVSLTSFEKRQSWLEVMLASKDEKISNLAHFFITLSTFTQDLTAEQIMDLVIGNQGVNISDSIEEKIFVSPYKAFYFPEPSPDEVGRDYLELLSNLSFLIKKIRRLSEKDPLYLNDLVEVINLHEKYALPINDPGHLFAHQGGVNLLTAHKSKGLEFDAVFVFNCEEEVWSDKGGDKFNMLPSNLPILPEKDNQDDVLRLFYVALSRAKQSLYVTYHTYDESGRQLSPLRFIEAPEDELSFLEDNTQNKAFIKVLEAKTFNLKSPAIATDEQLFLKTKVQNYQLSITHLNDFIDLTNCGPEKFFEKNILRFPILPTVELSYGNAIHKSLDRFYKAYKKFNILPSLNNLLDFYKDALATQRLNASEFERLFAKGKEKLTNYYSANQATFNNTDQSEKSFGYDGFTVVDGIPIKGKVDRFRVNEATAEITVFDYKTGKPLKDLEGYSSNEKVKAYKYKNQLIFYKLLIENSRNYKGKYSVHSATLEFIDEQNAPRSITHEITPEDTANLKALIKSVYHRITNLDFKSPDLEDPDFGDMIDFISSLTQQ